MRARGPHAAATFGYRFVLSEQSSPPTALVVETFLSPRGAGGMPLNYACHLYLLSRYTTLTFSLHLRWDTKNNKIPNVYTESHNVGSSELLYSATFSVKMQGRGI